jgi:hypothetical protein
VWFVESLDQPSSVVIPQSRGEFLAYAIDGAVWHIGGTACPASNPAPALLPLALIALALLLIRLASLALLRRRAVT